MKMTDAIHYREAPYGFEYGAMSVERLLNNPARGWAVLGIYTDKQNLEIYSTKTGKVRVFSPEGEWTLVKKGKKRGR